MKLSERIEQDGLGIESTALGVSQDGLRITWFVKLSRPDGRTFELPDPYEDNDEPTAFNVLDLIALHCSTVDQVNTREEWAAEYTTDFEERERSFPEEKFEAWRKINDDLKSFLGHQGHEDYLYNTDRSA